MKYWLSFLGILGGALWLTMMPHSAFAAEQQPIVAKWAPAQIAGKNFSGTMLTVEGQMWPDRQYGLSAYLFDRQTLTRIPLETFSYTPLAERMIVQIPTYVKAPETTRAYDLYVTTINGTQTIVDNAVLVSLETPVIAPPPSGGIEEPTVTPPPIVPTPSTDIVKDTKAAPLISSYTQEQPWSATNGGVIVINGNGWPMTMHGLTALLVNPATDLHVRLETISYVPDAGRMLVQTPHYGTGATAGWYNLIVMTQSGERTTIHNAVQYTE